MRLCCYSGWILSDLDPFVYNFKDLLVSIYINFIEHRIFKLSMFDRPNHNLTNLWKSTKMFVIVRLVDNIWLLINLSQIKQHSIELHNVSGFKWLNNVVTYFLSACTYNYRAKFCIGTRALTSTCTYEHKKPSKVTR